MKKIILELDDTYDSILCISAIGVSKKYKGLENHTVCATSGFDLSQGTHIKITSGGVWEQSECWYGNSNLGKIFTDQRRSISLFPYRSNQTVRMDRQQPKKWLPFMERHKGVNQTKKVWKIFRWNKCYLVNHLKSVAPVCYLLGTSCRGSFLLWRRC